MINRAEPNVVISLPIPAVVRGKPVLPDYWAKPTSFTVTATRGSHAIRAEHAAPKPTPYGGYYYPPASTGYDVRWSVEHLPDPAGFGGFYWLGDPTGLDGTAGITSGARQWAADPATGGPSWHSHFPFKPSVVSVDHYLFGGDQVHHPRAVNFNAHFIEHMWLDFGSDHRQPFTWVIAAMMTDFPTRDFRHHLLDSGRSPDAVGFPRIGADQTGTARRINDNLPYRNLMRVGENQIDLAARVAATGPGTVHARLDSGERPKMYIGIFNGAKSYVGAYSPGRSRLQRGSLDHGTDQHHRYYVMGRRNGVISPYNASHMIVFEIRYWRQALTLTQLDTQYKDLASRHQFDRYRRD